MFNIKSPIIEPDIKARLLALLHIPQTISIISSNRFFEFHFRFEKNLIYIVFIIV